MRMSTNISVKEQRRFVLSDFLGVDFSNSKLRVQYNRATEMKNFINDYGMMRKRNGWKQILPKFENGINGIYPYRNELLGRDELLIYCGTNFYCAWEENGEYKFREIPLPEGVELQDERVQFFSNKGRIYVIGCGDFLYYKHIFESDTNDMRRVALYCSGKDDFPSDLESDELPKIPTTTVSINQMYDADSVRASLDGVNLLTNLRKNTLLGNDQQDSRWKLDGKIIRGCVSITLSVKETVVDDSGAPAEEIVVEYQFNGNENLQIVDDNNEQVGSYKEDGTIILNRQTIPPMEGEPNITVYFATPIDQSEKITKCKIGTLFGIGGNDDRLFLAGNPTLSNVEFFSESDDFTYFPDQFTATFGTDRSGIVSFLRMSDNTLAVFKEYSDREVSVYFQNGEYRTFYDDVGNLQKIIPVFGITAGATLEGSLNAFSSANLAGENLILSKNGVFAIELTENVATNTRTARERSRSINARLCKEKNLENAAGIVFDGKYYISINGVCYVADSRYRYQPQDSAEYNYEWWYWTNVPARIWCNVNNSLWFGTEDGRICKFDEEFCDRSFEQRCSGEFGFDFANGKMVLDENVHLKNDDRFIIKTDGVFAIYSTEIDFVSAEGKITLNEDVRSSNRFPQIYEGDAVYVDSDENVFPEHSTAREGIEYYVCDVDRVECSFYLRDSEGKKIIFNNFTYQLRLLRKISNIPLYVANLDTNNNSFDVKLTKDGEEIKICNYFQPDLESGGEKQVVPTNPILEIWHHDNVIAEWYTPLFDLGTNESSKSLLKLTVSTEPMQGGKLVFGYETRSAHKDFFAHGTQKFSFDDFDFSNFSFETGFANSYSVKVKERNFNFIRFRFRSDNDKNCTINDFTVTYKINKRNLEVR